MKEIRKTIEEIEFGHSDAYQGKLRHEHVPMFDIGMSFITQAYNETGLSLEIFKRGKVFRNLDRDELVYVFPSPSQE